MRLPREPQVLEIVGCGTLEQSVPFNDARFRSSSVWESILTCRRTGRPINRFPLESEASDTWTDIFVNANRPDDNSRISRGTFHNLEKLNDSASLEFVNAPE